MAAGGWLVGSLLSAGICSRYRSITAGVQQRMCFSVMLSGPSNSFQCLGHSKNVYDDDDDGGHSTQIVPYIKHYVHAIKHMF